MTTALAAYDHTVHVSYFARKGVSGSFGRRVSVRESRSTDDGQTFAGEVTISPQIDLRYSAVTTGLHFLGDYMGIAVSHEANPVAHAVWCRSFRPGQPAEFHQTTWSASILP
jgi:hypothetical protein